MDKIAVYPTKGWWQENRKKQTEEMKIRFSLLVDIETEELTVDLHAKIQSEIETLIKSATVVSI